DERHRADPGQEAGAAVRAALHGPPPQSPGPDQPLPGPPAAQQRARDGPPAGGAAGAAPPLEGPRGWRAPGEPHARPRRVRRMRIALIVQRYGEEVIGGAELHARWIAQRLAQRHQVEVLTTCAVDYLTWENKYEPGPATVGGLPVRRFEVARRRTAEGFD